MNKSTALLLPALGLPALVAFGPASNASVEKISFAPADGTTVTKTFTSTAEFALDDMAVTMNGQEPPMPEIEMNITTEQVVTVTDTYRGVSDGRPTALARSYDAISMGMEVETAIDMMGETQEEGGEGSGGSELEGQTVIFKWNEEDGEFEASFPEDAEGDADLLENLSEDMDLRGLLPTDAIGEGESYSIDLASMIDLFAPGGDLKIDLEMDGMDEGMSMGPDPAMMSNMREIFEEMVEGDASGRLASVKEVDGARVAVIELTIEINAARDMSDLAADAMGDQLPEGMDASIDRMDVELSFEGGGELHWNLSAGHAHALEIKGDMEMTMDMEMAMDMGGQSMDMAMDMAMSGTIENTLETE